VGKIINYIPSERDTPNVLLNVATAWGDIHTILKDIIKTFNIKTHKALEFGVQYGFSASALANYFEQVVGVDTFIGDIHAGVEENFLDRTQYNLREFNNIKLIESSYQEYIKKETEKYNLIHIDIVHTYEDTFACGEWAVKNSEVTIFHDTESFHDVKLACLDLSEKYDLKFYNYPHSHGLGILI
jgi:hypothetical protein